MNTRYTSYLPKPQSAGHPSCQSNNIANSTTDPRVEFFCLLASFNSTKNFVQCKKSFMRAMSKFKTHVSDCTPSQVAG